MTAAAAGEGERPRHRSMSPAVIEGSTVSLRGGATFVSGPAPRSKSTQACALGCARAPRSLMRHTATEGDAATHSLSATSVTARPCEHSSVDACGIG